MPTLRSFLHSERVKTRVLTRFVGDKRQYPQFVDDICDYVNAKAPAVALCDPAAIVRAIAQLASWNLTLGEGAWLVARRPVAAGEMPDCYAMQSYRGKVYLLTRRYKLIENWQAHCFYENEKLEVMYGSRPDVVHDAIVGPRRGELKGFYVMGDERHGGARHVVVMHRSEVDKIRKEWSELYGDGDLDDIEWYGLRTATHRFEKRIPISADVRRVITEDGAGSATDFGDEEDIPSLAFERGSTVTVFGSPEPTEDPFAAMQNVQGRCA